MGLTGQGPGANHGVAAATTADDLGELMRAVARAQHKFNVTTARVLALAPNDVWALEHLLADGPLGPAELARRLGMTTASATTLIDRLEAAGHVARRPHPVDRRRLAVVPTAHASAAAYRAIAPFLNELDAAAADLAPEERAVVARYLTQVIAALRTFGEPDGSR